MLDKNVSTHFSQPELVRILLIKNIWKTLFDFLYSAKNFKMSSLTYQIIPKM